MKTATLILAGAAMALAAPAFAQSAAKVDARIEAIDAKLDARVRTGVLTASEQQALRDRLQAVRRDKQAQEADGLTPGEADKLLAQLDPIEAGIMKQSRDAQSADTSRLDSFAEFDKRITSMVQRVEAGVAAGSLNADEAMGVRGNIDDLKARLDRYRTDNVLSAAERRDLNTRFEVVSGGIARQRNDGQTG